MIKCANGWNYCSIRSELINRTTIECPCCSSVETWEYVIRCCKTKKFRKQFIADLLLDLMKNRTEDMNCSNLFDLIEDTLWYLDREEQEECDTNQEMIGTLSLFRGHTVKV